MQFHATGIVLAALTVVSVASAQRTQAVEWKVSEGGNGHWYANVFSGNISWHAAQTDAESKGAHLATLITAAENSWVYFNLPDTSGGPWIGIYQPPGTPEPNGGWRWVTGEPVTFLGWCPPYQPDDLYGLNEDYGHLHCAAGWNDVAVDGRYLGGIFVTSYLSEWEADCNNDGIVDYGQILRGELEDLNGNGVPDICETSISSVLPPSVPAQGGSTITIRGNGFPANPTVLIGGVPATNVVRESMTRITATSPAVLPGMASVSVNDFTLADGIYVRPECGSDLDQNGVVDTADISIILLDFGPCYEPPAALAAHAPSPLLADEPPQTPVQR
jgi:hypothetical protein